MSIQYPLVPVAPGVPNVLRKSGSIVAAAVMLLKDAVSAYLSAPSEWGIFLKGKSVLVADSVVSLDYRKEWHLSDYPIEQGNFETFNKVRMPYDARITFSKGGTDADRNEFLATIETISGSLDLYDVVTPETTYTNANISHFDYRRTAINGVSLLSVTIWLQEIRATAASTFAQVETAQPSGAPQANGGVVQPTDAPPGVPAPDISATTNVMRDPLPSLPQGYSYDPQTGVILNSDGSINESMTRENASFDGRKWK